MMIYWRLGLGLGYRLGWIDTLGKSWRMFFGEPAIKAFVSTNSFLLFLVMIDSCSSYQQLQVMMF